MQKYIFLSISNSQSFYFSMWKSKKDELFTFIIKLYNESLPKMINTNKHTNKHRNKKDKKKIKNSILLSNYKTLQ